MLVMVQTLNVLSKKRLKDNPVTLLCFIFPLPS